MAKGEGKGWHRDPRGHREAALKGQKSSLKSGAAKARRPTRMGPKKAQAIGNYYIDNLDHVLNKEWDSLDSETKAQALNELDALASLYSDAAVYGRRVEKPRTRASYRDEWARQIYDLELHLASHWYEMTPGQRKDFSENLDMMHESFRRDLEHEQGGGLRDPDTYHADASTVKESFQKAFPKPKSRAKAGGN